MLVYGSYWTDHSSYPISVTTGGVVNVKLAAASGAAQQVYTSTTTPCYVRSASSTTYTYVATSAARALKCYSSTSSPVYTASPSSSVRTAVYTPASLELTTKNIYSLATASFTSAHRVAGTAANTSTTITAGLYRCMAVGNTFFLRVGGNAGLTTLTLPLADGYPETFYFESTKVFSISATTAGALYMTKVR